jgi:hypothetical protein
MEHWKTEKLFDDKPYIDHHYILPNVVEIKPIREASGHDDSFDNLKCDDDLTDAVRAKIFNLPRRFPPEDMIA